jgi:sulfur relay (sulfurtransferase) DsrC/TusE family protein
MDYVKFVSVCADNEKWGKMVAAWNSTRFVCYKQGGQIGRIFAYWAIVYFEQFFSEDYNSCPNFGLLISTVKN